ncbi:hotdog family protein [Flavobacterium silvaticum]|uniref:3-hydroxyacyl-ACP dehydratase n=1 Tax=Flavobacterium silvaticum TaxID=1852020 RepID=A0A972JH96_9FLAO|nr:3-hydroxyacyl-ACP dehydratase [Flavobacterium silvaticum]NMH27705.1 3-hydroxyacyl-ACP dehydratase [Flavobacterium silvaticum]
MLLKDFYTVNDLTSEDGKHTAHIHINAGHEIFSGHFPGNPVMPGVCMMQIIKELTERILGSGLMMVSISNVKFMALINPEVNSELKLELEASETSEGLVKVKNTTYFQDTVALKFSGMYKKPLL